MLKRTLLAASVLFMLPLPALAENGCDGYCRGGERGWRGHDRHYSRNYHRPRTVVSFNYGFAPRPYPYPYYRPAHVMYAPYPVAPQPQIVYMNDMNSREVASDDGRYCREYQAVSTIAGRKQQTYGTACMQPDGSWEIVS